MRLLERALFWGMAIAVSVFCISLASAATDMDILETDYEIEAQSLKTALENYQKTSGLNLAYSDKWVEGRYSHGARGSYTQTLALEKILEGTDLTYTLTRQGTVVLMKNETITAQKSAAEKKTDIKKTPAESATGGGEEKEKSVLEAMVVTATRTERPINETPAAATAITEQEIIDRGAQSITEALQGAPSIRVGYYTEGNFPVIQMRGAGDAGLLQNTDVLVLIDDIPQVNINDQSFYDQLPFEAVERIEIVRGPTSALYGRNAIGGVINIITRDAPIQPEISGTLTTGSFGFIKPQVTFGGPVSDSIWYLLSASYETYDGWRDGADRNAGDLFGKLDFDLGTKTGLSLTARYMYGEQGVVTILPLRSDASEVPGIDRTTNYNLPDAEARNKVFQLGATLNHEFSNELAFTGIGYYRYTDRILERDGSWIDNLDTTNQTMDLYPFSPATDESIFGFEPRFTWTPSM
ncbi:MAG: TonB-dependent receptor [Desulfobacterales bacterium]|nr:TonB-dependent receptor [Desulfobacterales bacterium]